MELFDTLDKQISLFSDGVESLKTINQSFQTILNDEENLIKKVRQFKDNYDSTHKEIIDSLNSHQQTIERQISEIRIAMGAGIEGERKNPLSTENMKELETMIGKQAGEIVYQGSVDGFSNDSFNKFVGGKKETVTIILDGEGNIYGCYNSLQIPVIEDRDTPAKGIYGDNDFVLFSLRKKGVDEVHKYTRKNKDGYSFWVFGTMQNILSINGAFMIVNDCNKTFDSSTSGNFKREFDQDMFIDKQKFMVRDIVVIQFS